MNACILKYVELVLTIACVVHYSYDLTDVSTLVLCSGTFVAFLIVLTGEIIGDLVSAPIDIVLDMYYSAVGCALAMACGASVLLARLRDAGDVAPPTGDHSSALTLAGLCLLLSAVMLLDLVLAYCDAEEYDDEDSI